MAPIIFMGLAVAGGLALLSRASSSGGSNQTIDNALIDPSEKAHPNAALAQQAIAASMTRNSASLYEMTAIAIETRLGMPKTAANVRTWAKMAAQGGQQVAGEDDDVGADDEVGAARRVVRKLYAKHKAAKAKPKPRPSARPVARPARLGARPRPSSSRPSSSPAPALALVDWSPNDEPDDEPDDAEIDDAGGGDEDDDVGASRPRKRLPDWLRFSATQSKLTGDPKFIRATAAVMHGMGYAEHAAIHLKSID
jgi:hypothetical protein